MDYGQILVVDVHDHCVGEADRADVVFGEDTYCEIAVIVWHDFPIGRAAADAGFEIDVEAGRICAGAAVDGEQGVLVLFGDEERYLRYAAFDGILEDGFDVDLLWAGGLAGEAFYGIGQAGIVGIGGLVNCIRAGAGVAGALHNADLGDGVRRGPGDVQIQSGRVDLDIRREIGNVELDIISAYVVVVWVDSILDDDLDFVKCEPVLPEAVFVDVMGDELDMVGLAGREVAEDVGGVRDEPAVRRRSLSAATFSGDAVADEVEVVAGGVGCVDVPACVGRVEPVHYDVVFQPDFYLLDSAGREVEIVEHFDVLADGSDSILRFEVAGAVL